MLRVDVKLARGEAVPAEQVLRLEGRGRLLARKHLVNGHPRRCVTICQDELKRTPNDPELLDLLGRAQLMLGERDECRKSWEAALRAAPQKAVAYNRLLQLLSKDGNPAAAAKTVRAMPQAIPYLVDMALASSQIARGDYEGASATFLGLANDDAVPAYYRSRSRLLGAGALAAKGEIDAALTQLAELAKDPAWQVSARFASVNILIVTQRPEDAAKALSELHGLVKATKDVARLRQIARAYLRIGRGNAALAVYDEILEIQPNDASTYLLKSEAFSQIGKLDAGILATSKAVELQPGNINAYIALARLLDLTRQPLRALQALEQLQKAGKVGARYALLERGNMLRRWGLHAEAENSFRQLLDREQDFGIPQLQFSLGQVLAATGDKSGARTALRSISAHSPLFLAAQSLLANIAETVDAKLVVMDGMEKASPASANVVVQKMAILVKADRHADAVKTYESFLARWPTGAAPPARPADAMVHLLLAARDRVKARDLAVRMAKATGSPRWRQVSVLLSIEDGPATAIKLLPSPDKAGPLDALLGVALSVQARDVPNTTKWTRRLQDINQQLSQLTPPRPLPPSLRLLSAIAGGQTSRAKQEAEVLLKGNRTVAAAAADILAAAGSDGRPSIEAARLLDATVAMYVELRESARSIAMDVLKARPTCQWAAGLALRTGLDAKGKEELLARLRPSDNRLSQQVRAELMMAEGKHKEAAEAFRLMSEKEKEDDFDLVMSRAIALERANQLPSAFGLYLRVWQATKSPAAANNAAYLVTQLYATDEMRLKEARGWMDEVIKAHAVPAFHDTKGYVELLLGEKDAAVDSLRRAVRGLPNSPEVQYHLGIAEAAVGNPGLARWHLEAAVGSAAAMEADGKKLSPAEIKAREAAKIALAKTPPEAS